MRELSARIFGYGAVVVAMSAMLAGCATQADRASEDRSAPPSISPERQSQLVATAGECYVDDPTGEAEDGGLIDCAEPHDYEIYHSEDLPEGEYPGTVEVREAADLICAKELPTFLGGTSEDLGLEFFSITPTVTMWDSEGDRGISCAVTDPDGPVTGTLENAGG